MSQVLSPNREFFKANVPDGRHFKTDAEVNEYFAIEIENAMAEAKLLSKYEDLMLEQEAMQRESESRRHAFLDLCSKTNYPEQWKDQVRLAELPEDTGC